MGRLFDCVLCIRYHTDPSGTFWQCNAKAIGSGSEGADTSLQEHYNKVSIFFPHLCSILKHIEVQGVGTDMYMTC